MKPKLVSSENIALIILEIIRKMTTTLLSELFVRYYSAKTLQLLLHSFFSCIF